jgi:acyl carrier protein
VKQFRFAAAAARFRVGTVLAFVVRATGDMDRDTVKERLKELMISELNLEGKRPADIDDAAPLFGEGLGLDSLDALQLAMAVEEHFAVQIPEGEEARPVFASVNALVDYIVSHRSP